jgi:hypothetical protein
LITDATIAGPFAGGSGIGLLTLREEAEQKVGDLAGLRGGADDGPDSELRAAIDVDRVAMGL